MEGFKDWKKGDDVKTARQIFEQHGIKLTTSCIRHCRTGYRKSKFEPLILAAFKTIKNKTLQQ